METLRRNIPTIILCGGTGMRLREETEFKPKPMVEIGGKPILWHIMKIYNYHGYRNFILALGYKGDYIKDYFLKQKYYEADFEVHTGGTKDLRLLENQEKSEEDFHVICADTGLETPHGERISMLEKYIKDDLFMVTYGDGLADIDIDKLVAFHKAKGKIATITGVHPTSKWGLAKADENDLVITLDQKPMLYDYVNGGFMVFDRRFFQYLKKGDMIEDALMRLVPAKELALYKHEGFWYGMDTYKDFLFLQQAWEKDAKWKVWQ